MPDENGNGTGYAMQAAGLGLDAPMLTMDEMRDPASKQLFSYHLTWRDFYSMRDQVLQKLEKEGKINIAEMKAAIKNLMANKNNPTSPEMLALKRNLEEMLEPVYIEMRLLGFTEKELGR
jgi:hypothetical protein